MTTSSDSMLIPSTISLHNKVAIVTGSSRGIGRVTAILLAQRGARVAIHCSGESSKALAAAVAEEINSAAGQSSTQPRACVVLADLTQLDSAARVIHGTLKGLEVSKIDILVHNAAVPQGTRLQATEFDDDAFMSQVSLNMRAPMLLVKELLPVLASSGGRIVTIGSIAAVLQVPGMSYYNITKAALESLTRQYATELSKTYKCTVNCVRVGATNTENSSTEEAAADVERQANRKRVIEMTTAANRLGETDDVAEIVAWLCSDSARWVNGQVVNGNGGIVFQ